MIKFRQLRFMAAIIDNAYSRQAAVALGLEQSALSRSIAKFERVVGTQLVFRSRPDTTATAAGTAFIQSSRQLIAIADRMLTQTRLTVATTHCDFAGLSDGITNEWASVITLASIWTISRTPVPTTAYHRPRQPARHHHARYPTHHDKAAHQPRIQ